MRLGDRMDPKTGLRLLLLFTVFSIVSVWLASLLGDERGIYALLVGWGIGLIATELYIPKLLQQWKVIGMPGDPRTPEQQMQWEKQKGKSKVRQNLSILAGLIIAAIGRVYLSGDMLDVAAIAIFSGVGAYFLRIGWLIYRKKDKLGL